MLRPLFYFLLLLICVNNLNAQTDSLKFKNGEILVGQIKSLKNGVLLMETDYSDKDFSIEWEKVNWIRTQSHFLISTKQNVNYYSTVYSLNDSVAKIIANDHNPIVISSKDIVYLNPYEDKFKDKFNAFIDIGFDKAQSNNLVSFSTRVGVNYKTKKWSADITYNSMGSKQDDTEDIRKIDAEANFVYVLEKKWYVITTLSTLQSNELKLDLRLNFQLGLGRFIYRTNKGHWRANFGLNQNLEYYTLSTDPDRSSWEAYLGSEFNIYHIKDFSVLLSATIYPGLTEKGRLRSDLKLDLKYDLPLDFYIKLGGSLNYDNQPADDTPTTDYVMHMGFGWKW